MPHTKWHYDSDKGKGTLHTTASRNEKRLILGNRPGNECSHDERDSFGTFERHCAFRINWKHINFCRPMCVRSAPRGVRVCERTADFEPHKGPCQKCSHFSMCRKRVFVYFHSFSLASVECDDDVRTCVRTTQSNHLYVLPLIKTIEQRQKKKQKAHYATPKQPFRTEYGGIRIGK